MRRAMGGVLAAVAVLAAGSLSRPSAAEAQRATVGRPAPELTGGPWINSEPLSLAGLRGRVVLVDFWTFG